MNNESFIKLRSLTVKAGEPIEAILQRAAGYLAGLNEKATFELRVSGASHSAGSTHSIILTASGASVRTGPVEKPTLVAVISSENFHRVADGSYSPVQAYIDGKLRLLGNVELGKNIVRKLKGEGTAVDVCPQLINESWKITSLGLGSLTFSGQFFTPGGTADIIYDWGGGFYQRIITANSSGAFTITEANLFCGDIPGHPGVGVIVTATDLASGQSTTQSYGTPC